MDENRKYFRNIIGKQCKSCRKVLHFLKEHIDTEIECPNCGTKMIPRIKVTRTIEFEIVNENGDKNE